MLPSRPKGNKEYKLTATEERCISYYIAFEDDTTKAEAWKLFILPTMSSERELKPTKVFLQNHAKLFFERPNVLEYIDDYRNTLELKFAPTEHLIAVDRASKEAAVKERLFNFVEDGLNKHKVPIGELKDLTAVMDKIGLFDGEKIEIKPPERYLPVSCEEECMYKTAIDKLVASGKGENECDRCKFKEYALSNGCKDFPPEKQLNNKQCVTESST